MLAATVAAESAASLGASKGLRPSLSGPPRAQHTGRLVDTVSPEPRPCSPTSTWPYVLSVLEQHAHPTQDLALRLSACRPSPGISVWPAPDLQPQVPPVPPRFFLEKLALGVISLVALVAVCLPCCLVYCLPLLGPNSGGQAHYRLPGLENSVKVFRQWPPDTPTCLRFTPLATWLRGKATTRQGGPQWHRHASPQPGCPSRRSPLVGIQATPQRSRGKQGGHLTKAIKWPRPRQRQIDFPALPALVRARYALCVTRAIAGEMDRRLGHACLPSPAQTPGSPAPLQPSDLLAPEGDGLPVHLSGSGASRLLAEGRPGSQTYLQDWHWPEGCPWAFPTPHARPQRRSWGLRSDTRLPSRREAPLGPSILEPRPPRAPPPQGTQALRWAVERETKSLVQRAGPSPLTLRLSLEPASWSPF